MSVNEYTKERPHPSGFIGFIVRRHVRGKARQRYFKTRGLSEAEIDALRRESERLDTAWAKEANPPRSARIFPDKGNVTGLAGVSWQYYLKGTCRVNAIQGKAVIEDEDGRRVQRGKTFSVRRKRSMNRIF